jgi:lysyl endopeptidase
MIDLASAAGGVGLTPEAFMRTALSTLLFVVLLACGLPAAAQHMSGAPAPDDGRSPADLLLRDPLYPAASHATRALPAPAPERIAELREQNSEPGVKLLRIGFERRLKDELPASELPALEWRPTADGGLTARIQLRSEGALALRSALDLSGLPATAELRFAESADVERAVAWVGGEEIARQRLIDTTWWSPVTEGDTQVIEIYLPAGSDPEWLRIGVPALSHMIVSPLGSLRGAKNGDSGSCNFDARCINNPSTAYINAKNSVARMVFQVGGESAFCTGTLLNDTDASTTIPYFFTAAHCFTSQTVANTLTTFWFYETTACGSGVLDGAARQLTGGASVLFASTGADVLFLRLNSAPPAGSFYLGWNAAQIANNANILVLHHPAGDYKKVSLGRVTGFGSSSLASGSFIKVGYTDGTTEGGSSGCALLTLSNDQYVLRGGLLGGSASCANTGSISTPDNSDDFSRFDLVFPNLQSFLQPAATTPPSTINYAGAWYNESQSGWGVNVISGTNSYAMFIYHYDQDSSPGWYLASGTLSGTSFSHPLLAFTGPWFGAPPFNPSAVANRTAGTISMNFTSATTATVTFTIDGRSVSSSLVKIPL